MRKCVASFGSVSIDDNEAYRWATLTFVGGMLIIAILDRVGGWWLVGVVANEVPAWGKKLRSGVSEAPHSTLLLPLLTLRLAHTSAPQVLRSRSPAAACAMPTRWWVETPSSLLPLR